MNDKDKYGYQGTPPQDMWALRRQDEALFDYCPGCQGLVLGESHPPPCPEFVIDLGFEFEHETKRVL